MDTPFHVQTDVCMACGACASVCPTGHITLEKIRDQITSRDNVQLIPSEYDVGLKGRKPVYVPYAQAVPNTPAIDRDVCMHFKTGGCKVCADFFCGVDAIDHEMEDEIIELEVGSIILAPGFEPFDPSKFDSYSTPTIPTSSPPWRWSVCSRPPAPPAATWCACRDHKEPKKIAWFQCVGSRDLNRCDNAYCSSVCCMYAIKEAVIAKEHAGDDLDCAIFFMDMRTHGKDFERFYEKAKEAWASALSAAGCTSIDPGRPKRRICRVALRRPRTAKWPPKTYDMVVLSVGLQTHRKPIELAQRLDIDLTAGQLLPDRHLRARGHLPRGHFRLRRLPGPQGYPPVGGGRQRRGGGGRRNPQRRPATPRPRCPRWCRKPTSSTNAPASACSSATAASISPAWWMCRRYATMPPPCPMSSMSPTTSTPAPRIPRRP